MSIIQEVIYSIETQLGKFLCNLFCVAKHGDRQTDGPMDRQTDIQSADESDESKTCTDGQIEDRWMNR